MDNFYHFVKAEYEKQRKANLPGMAKIKDDIKKHLLDGEVVYEPINNAFFFTQATLEALKNDGFKVVCVGAMSSDRLGLALEGTKKVRIVWS